MHRGSSYRWCMVIGATWWPCRRDCLRIPLEQDRRPRLRAADIIASNRHAHPHHLQTRHTHLLQLLRTGLDEIPRETRSSTQESKFRHSTKRRRFLQCSRAVGRVGQVCRDGVDFLSGLCEFTQRFFRFGQTGRVLRYDADVGAGFEEVRCDGVAEAG